MQGISGGKEVIACHDQQETAVYADRKKRTENEQYGRHPCATGNRNASRGEWPVPLARVRPVRSKVEQVIQHIDA